MNTQMNIAENQEKFIIHVDPQIAKIVSPVDRKELTSAYLQLFSGFAWRNWTNKYSLGRAWQTALTQCGAFADTKNKNNPAAKYLKNVYDAHKKYWSRIIMTHQGRENTINPNDQEIKKLRAHGERMIREAMDKINLILARYNEHTEEMVATQMKSQQSQAEYQAPHPQQTMPQTPPAQQSMPQQMNAPGQTTPQEQVAATDKQAQVTQKAQEKPQAQQQAQPQPVSQAQQQAQAQEMPQRMPNIQMKPAAQSATKSTAMPAKQSGAFAMVRNNVKQPTTAVADKPIDEPMAKPAQEKVIAKQPEQVVPKPEKEQQKPIVHYMAKTVTAQTKQSGALPAVRDKKKQMNVVKTEEKTKVEPKEQFAQAQKRIEINAAQRAQMQMIFQKQIQMWQFGQFRQNAA